MTAPGQLRRLFALDRHTDISGVSGAGVVAYGIETTTGLVVMRWLGDKPSTVIWESLEHAMAVHGHNGATDILTLAAPFPAQLVPVLRAAFARILDVAGIVGHLGQEIDELLSDSGVLA